MRHYLGREDTHALFDLGEADALADAWRRLGVASDVSIKLLSEAPLAVFLHEHLPLAGGGHAYLELAQRLVAFAADQPVMLLREDDDALRARYSDEQGRLRIADASSR